MIDPLYDEMYRLENRHWWFCAKRRIVGRALRKYLPPINASSPQKICDVGCGCGMMLQDLRNWGYDAVGVDASDKAQDYCRQRGITVQKGFLPDQLPLPPASMDAVLLLDVLEHVDDDANSFQAAVGLLRPGGILVCTVPACRWLWTQRDVHHEHKRRYSWRPFIDVLHSAPGTTVLAASYMNSFLFPLAVASRLASRILPAGQTDLSIPPLGINKLLENLYVSESSLFLRGLRLPCGLSLFGAVRKG